MWPLVTDSPLPGVELPVETGVPAAPFDVTVPPDGCQKGMTEYLTPVPPTLSLGLPRAHFFRAQVESTANTPQSPHGEGGSPLQ